MIMLRGDAEPGDSPHGSGRSEVDCAQDSDRDADDRDMEEDFSSALADFRLVRGDSGSVSDNGCLNSSDSAESYAESQQC